MHYVYSLRCPVDNQIKYIGYSKTPEKRFKQHIYNRSNEKVYQWVKSLKKMGLLPQFEILSKHIDLHNAYDNESALIYANRETVFNVTHAFTNTKYILTELNISNEDLYIYRSQQMIKEGIHYIRRSPRKIFYYESTITQIKKIQNERKTNDRYSKNIECQA